MGFLDEIKNKMHLGGQQGYDQGYGQDDDYGYDDGYDDSYQGNGYSGASGEGFYTQDEPSNGLLGQTRRGEAESVAVYTRSGQLVGDDSRHATTYNPPSRSQDSVASGYRPGAYDTPSSYAENTRARAAAIVATGVEQALICHVIEPQSVVVIIRGFCSVYWQQTVCSQHCLCSVGNVCGTSQSPQRATKVLRSLCNSFAPLGAAGSCCVNLNTVRGCSVSIRSNKCTGGCVNGFPCGTCRCLRVVAVGSVIVFK